MIGSNSRRVGVLVPLGNVMHALEFATLRPAGVTFQFEAFAYPAAGTDDFCQGLSLQMAEPLARLKAWGAEAVLVGCTTASMSCAHPSFIRRLQKEVDMPIVTAAQASRSACAALGLRSLAVATPYGQPNNQIVADFLRSTSIEVASIQGLDLDASPQLWREQALRLTPADFLAFSRHVDVPEAQGIYLPCTGVPSIAIVDALESSSGKPVVSSVQAGFWAVLNQLAVRAHSNVGGRLLRHWPDEPSS
jgi:arylmalonate decarboxylase